MSNAAAAVNQTNISRARGVLEEVVAETATKPGYIVFAVPGSSYKLHLRPTGPITQETGKRLLGTICAEARRVDKTTTGGRFVEPVLGRPRRVQGAVVATDAGGNTITVDAGGSGIPGFHEGLPIVFKLTDARQKAGDFAVGDFVGFDVLDGATFTQG